MKKTQIKQQFACQYFQAFNRKEHGFSKPENYFKP